MAEPEVVDTGGSRAPTALEGGMTFPGSLDELARREVAAAEDEQDQWWIVKDRHAPAPLRAGDWLATQAERLAHLASSERNAVGAGQARDIPRKIESVALDILGQPQVRHAMREDIDRVSTRLDTIQALLDQLMRLGSRASGAGLEVMAAGADEAAAMIRGDKGGEWVQPTGRSPSTLHLLDTADADQWATAFVRIFSVQGYVTRREDGEIVAAGGREGDEDLHDLLRGWFANAIETGRRFGEKGAMGFTIAELKALAATSRGDSFDVATLDSALAKIDSRVEEAEPHA